MLTRPKRTYIIKDTNTTKKDVKNKVDVVTFYFNIAEEENSMIADKVKELERENISLKAQIETLQNICGNRAELPQNCEYCINFIQHYAKNGNTYYPVCAGHCVAGNRTRSRKTTETCKAFEQRRYGRNMV